VNTILAMDTSGPSLSVALTQEERVVFECVQQNGLTHSDSLMPMIDQALKAAGLGLGDVDCLAAVHGPGSFTGVRIGVATAKALSHGTGKPCIGINALEALAMGAALSGGVVCPMQDARAGQVYAAAFQGKRRMLADMAIGLEDFLSQIRPFGRCCFVGDGAVRHKDAITEAMGEAAVFPPMGQMQLRASQVAVLAARYGDQAGDWRGLMPYYLRLPQAERERASREAAHG